VTVRDYVYNLIVADPELPLFTDDTVFTSNDADTPQVRPFMVLRWGPVSLGMGVVNRRALSVWVHDDGYDYDVIDVALKRVVTLLTTPRAVWTGTTGEWVSQVDWDGTSDDLRDDTQRTATRHADFTVIGSGV